MKRILFLGLALFLAFSSIFVYAKNDTHTKNIDQLRTRFEQNKKQKYNNGFHGNHPKKNNNKLVDLTGKSLFSKGRVVENIKNKLKEKNISVKEDENNTLMVFFDVLENRETVDDLDIFTGLQNTGVQENTINIIWFK